MNKFYLTLLISLLTTAILAQDVGLEWAKSIGGTDPDGAKSITTDAFGNVYITGYYQGTVDFDPGVATFNLTSSGSNDIFVQKLDTAGNFIWAKSMGVSTTPDQGTSITTDELGYVYVTGLFAWTTFIQKLDGAGNSIWLKTFGGSGTPFASSIATDTMGNVYTTGTFDFTVDFDPGIGTFNLTSNSSPDAFIHKLDANGNFIWVKTMGGTGQDFASSISTDASANLYISGFYNGTVDFDPDSSTFNLISNGIADGFIVKLNSSGNLKWAKSVGGSFGDRANFITTNASGSVYITGFFFGTVDFDPGADTFNLTSTGGNFDSDIFIQKLDTGGNFIWAKSMGGTSSIDRGNFITTDTLGNVYTIGMYDGKVDFDPGVAIFNMTSNLGSNGFIQKLDIAGNFVWAKSWRADFSVDINHIDIFIAGTFVNTLDADPGASTFNLISNGNNVDVFILKLAPCTPSIGIGTDFITACVSHTWINGKTYTTSNNTDTYAVKNPGGCDSLVRLNLTINPVEINVSVADYTLTSHAAGASYQWLDCTDSTAITGETEQSFTASVNGSYAVEVTENGCTDTSVCITISKVGIIKNDFGSSLIVYPNPTPGTFTIDLGQAYKDVSVAVSNILGQLISNQQFGTKQQMSIDLAGPEGFYLIEIQTGEGKSATLKVLKE